MEEIFGDIFNQPLIRTPKDVLQDFKNQIEKESSGVVTASINEITQSPLSAPTKNISVMFAIQSSITGYSYNLLTTTYDILMYPCIIDTEPAIIEQGDLINSAKNHSLNDRVVFGIKIDNEHELINTLKIILTTARSKTIMRAIFSQR